MHPRKNKQKIGISSYTYTWSIGMPGFLPPCPMTALNLLKKAHTFGVKVLQIADNLPLHLLDDSAIQDLKVLSKKTGIAIEVGTKGLKPSVLKTYISIAERLNAKILRILIDDRDYTPSPAHIVSILKDFSSCLKVKNIILAIENHDRFKAEVYARIIEKTGSDHVGICLDTINSIGTYESLENIVEVLSPYTVNVHLKDFTIERLSHRLGFIVQGAPLGSGMLPIDWFFKKMAGFKRVETCILELWTPPETTIHATMQKEDRWASTSLEFLKKKYPELWGIKKTGDVNGG